MLQLQLGDGVGDVVGDSVGDRVIGSDGLDVLEVIGIFVCDALPFG